MLVKYKLINGAKLPEYETTGASGADLKANNDETIVLKPLQRCLIPTGLCLEIGECYEAQIRPRSGLFKKFGILAVLGTIDSDYRGEICVQLVNLSDAEFTINKGDRIAQIVFAGVIKAQFIKGELNETKRGDNGFGSTGYKTNEYKGDLIQ